MTFRSVPMVLMLAASMAAASLASGQPTKPAAKPAAGPAGQRAGSPAPRAGGPGRRGRAAAPGSAARTARLKNPAGLKEVAPASYKVAFDTTAGPFIVQVHRDWAPKGADRFYNLVKNGFYDGNRFFRVVPNFMVQFGIHGTPTIQSAWRNANLQDDPVTQSNKRGYITFATAGPNTRTTQVFINFRDNGPLDGQGFAPFGEVLSGMEVVDKINAEYRERPDQGRMQAQGNAYLTTAFPKLDFVRKATIQK